MSEFKDHFSGNSEVYASHRPEYPAALFDHLAALCGGERRHAWDCATGNGQAARGLARHFQRVTATDASADQIAQALPHAGVEFRVAPAEASGLADASVDLLCVAQAAHWFDLPRFYAEARRVLRPGGVLALWCYERLSVSPEIDALIKAFYSVTLGPCWPPERRWVENGYRDLPFPLEELVAPRLDMSAVWTLPRLLGYFSTWSAVKAYRKAQGVDPLAPLARQLKDLWPDPEEARPIRWPLAFRIGRAPR